MVTGNGTAVVFRKGFVTPTNIYEKVKIFEIIESRKPTGNTDDPFTLEMFFSCINIPA